MAFLVGVLVQTTSLQAGFDRLFRAESADIDLVVRSDRVIEADDETFGAACPLSVLDAVRAARVAAAEADIRGTAVILVRDGDEVGTPGPPRLGLTWIDDPDLPVPDRVRAGARQARRGRHRRGVGGRRRPGDRRSDVGARPTRSRSRWWAPPPSPARTPRAG
ncbi:MAG: hypothetical protein R2711_16390 [Acidimicrobiales bacterium]